MIKFKEKTLLILDENGDTVPFQIDELQAELAECFRHSNSADESSFAEDIILSLDYFFNEHKSGSIYSIQELNQMVASILDEAGFFDVAEVYRKKKNFLEPLYSTSAESLYDLLTTKIFFPSGNLKAIAEKTAQIFSACNLKEATLSLIIEMSKFVNISLSSIKKDFSVISKKGEKRGYYLKDTAIRKVLAEKITDFVDYKFIQVGGVSKIHSAVKIYVDLLRYPAFYNIEEPLMELELTEKLYSISEKLDLICDVIIQKCQDTPELQNIELPIYLNLINMRGFAEKCMGVNLEQGGKKLIKEVGELLKNGMRHPIYKVIFKEKLPFLEKK